MLFHFFNSKTQISDNYILDPVSSLKLYPTKSNCIRATALSTGFAIPNSEIDLITEIESFFHHKLADLENFGYLFAGENTVSPYATTGLYITSGKIAYSWLWKGSTGGGCIILSSALEDDNWYISNCYVAATLSMKMRKVTIVNNALVIGSDINSTTTAKGTEALTSDLGILSGKSGANYVYSSKHKLGYIKIYGAGRVLMHHFVFSEGAESQVFDVVTGNSYTIANTTLPNLWENKQDFVHNNFKNGFTLYQKSGSPDLRIPNKANGSEIVPSSIPTGYARIANYKGTTTSYNQCESKFKLDDVSAGIITISATFNTRFWGATFSATEEFVENGTLNGKAKYLTADNDIIAWTGWAWGLCSHRYPSFAQMSSTQESIDAALTAWNGVNQSFVKSVSSPSALYSADHDHVLFTENTGVAKEIEIQDIYSEIVDLTHDRGRLYINSDSNKNMMLYKTDKGVDTPEDFKIWAYVEK